MRDCCFRFRPCPPISIFFPFWEISLSLSLSLFFFVCLSLPFPFFSLSSSLNLTQALFLLLCLPSLPLSLFPDALPFLSRRLASLSIYLFPFHLMCQHISIFFAPRVKVVCESFIYQSCLICVFAEFVFS